MSECVTLQSILLILSVFSILLSILAVARDVLPPSSRWISQAKRKMDRVRGLKDDCPCETERAGKLRELAAPLADLVVLHYAENPALREVLEEYLEAMAKNVPSSAEKDGVGQDRVN